MTVEQRQCACGADLTGTHWRRKWCSDWCRKATKYGGTCEECGALTDGSNGHGKAPTRCIDCFNGRNEERNNRIEEMWREGFKAWEIGEEFGLSATNIASLIQQRRESDPTIPMHSLPHHDNRERSRRIASLIRAGKSNAEIGAIFGISTGAANQLITSARKRGVDMPYRDEVAA